jgi:hypothetical protein
MFFRATTASVQVNVSFRVGQSCAMTRRARVIYW